MGIWVTHNKYTLLDLQIDIHGTQIQTTIYEKSLNLYLYLPPHSCHPPGVLKGLIHGRIRQFMLLCRDREDGLSYVLELFRRLRLRGYATDMLRPIFEKALQEFMFLNPDNFSSEQKPKQNLHDTSIFLHVKYHPSNLSSQTCQEVFQSCLLNYQTPFNVANVKNQNGNPLGNEKLIVVYHKPATIGDQFSVRKVGNLLPQSAQLETPNDSLDCWRGSSSSSSLSSSSSSSSLMMWWWQDDEMRWIQQQIYNQ